LRQFQKQINIVEVFDTEGDFALRYLLEQYEKELNSSENLVHLIFSNDNDFKQLLSEEFKRNVFIYDFGHKKIISKSNFDKFYDYTPESVLYGKIFTGD
jgi:hypothetical protein